MVLPVVQVRELLSEAAPRAVSHLVVRPLCNEELEGSSKAVSAIEVDNDQLERVGRLLREIELESAIWRGSAAG